MLWLGPRLAPCDTKLGTLVIGYFSLIQALICTGVILLGFALLIYYAVQDNSSRGILSTNKLWYMVVELLTCLLINFVHIAVSMLLLRGVRKEKRGLLIPWLVATCVAILVFVSGLAVCHIHGYCHPVLLGVFGVLSALDTSFVVVVLCHFRHLGRRHTSWDYEDLKVLRSCEEVPDEMPPEGAMGGTHKPVAAAPVTTSRPTPSMVA